MTLQELLQNSIQAEQSGIAVDWRATAHNILRDASAGVAGLEEKVLLLQRWQAEAIFMVEDDSGGDFLAEVNSSMCKKKEAEAPNE